MNIPRSLSELLIRATSKQIQTKYNTTNSMKADSMKIRIWDKTRNMFVTDAVTTRPIAENKLKAKDTEVVTYGPGLVDSQGNYIFEGDIVQYGTSKFVVIEKRGIFGFGNAEKNTKYLQTGNEDYAKIEAVLKDYVSYDAQDAQLKVLGSVFQDKKFFMTEKEAARV